MYVMRAYWLYHFGNEGTWWIVPRRDQRDPRKRIGGCHGANDGATEGCRPSPAFGGRSHFSSKVCFAFYLGLSDLSFSFRDIIVNSRA
jgi:hypothetical protein